MLVELERELRGYPSGLKGSRPMPVEPNAIVHPLRLAHGDQVLSFISTITVFGTPLDVTLSELAIESFFPADEQTRTVLVRLAKEGRSDRLRREVSPVLAGMSAVATPYPRRLALRVGALECRAAARAR